LLPLLFSGPLAASAESGLRDARLLRFPDIHGETIVFSYAGDLWTVPAGGGDARRLTTGEGLEIFPRFSPDGEWIAFTGEYDGTVDVYVIPAGGGIPRRLTWYPSNPNSDRMGWDNMVIGWTPGGKILFRSQRGPQRGFVGMPYTVSPRGGPVERFPLPESGIISFSPDGKKIAYNRTFREFRTWKRYRGGMAQDVWIHDLENKSLQRITDWEGTDHQPMWLGDAIYFVSDREDWKLNLWRYDLPTGNTTRVTDFREYDVKWPHSGTGKIVFENGGHLHIHDPAAGKTTRVVVNIPDDRTLVRPRWVDVTGRITGFNLAPGGERAVFSARGDVFTVPAKRGNTRNITATQGVRERGASWSPDGKWVACISDRSGEEEIYLIPQDGKGAPLPVTRGSSCWHFSPVWSPDSKKLAWSERNMCLRYVEIPGKGENTEINWKEPVLVDRAEVWEISLYTWSPDSRWIAYVKELENGMPAVFLYSLETGSTTRVTGAHEQSREPAFDPGGKYLYFFSDRDVNPELGHFELSFTVNRMARPYAITLRADLPSPFAPESDEAKITEDERGAKEDEGKEKGEEKGDGGKVKEEKPELRIDLPGIQDRIVGFPVPPGEYGGLRAARGSIYYMSFPERGQGKPALHRYDLEKREDQVILAGLNDYDLAPDGSRVIYRSNETFGIVEPRKGVNVGEGKLDLSGLKMELDPAAEWAQIFREVWRLDRDFFYLPDMGKVDWEAIRRRYERLLPYVSHRIDLTYILGEMIGELESGHTYVGGGEQPRPERVEVGLLGADLELDRKAGLWRIARILQGQNWTESRRSPLTEPGVQASAGEYLLAIDGNDLLPDENPQRLLVQETGRTVRLLLNSKPTREGAREVTVKPIASEADLRYYNWVENNRLRVARETGGRVGYIHVPDMQSRGLREFIRQYYPQIRKEGLIVDVRYNGGGYVSQILLERLRRILIGMVAPRNARPGTVPRAVFNGPMVALLNRYSASDGDLFPYYFRKYGLGPLIGKRSWGGVVGIRGIRSGLVDGGYLTVPEFAHYGLKSQWIIENHGVDPDLEVDNLPQEEMAGRDPQLERGIREVMRLLEEKEPRFPPRPPSRDLRPSPAERRIKEL